MECHSPRPYDTASLSSCQQLVVAASAAADRNRASDSCSQGSRSSHLTPCGLQAARGSQEPSQTQTEILTQNPDLTQLGDDLDDEDAVLASPYSPSAARRIPWGRLIPCSPNHSWKGVDLLPRAPLADSHASSGAQSGIALAGRSSQSASFLGLFSLRPSDIFNEYILGRSPKCDIQATQPTSFADEKAKARHSWAYGLISNRHCKLYCCLDPNANTSTSTDVHSMLNSWAVYIEDSSGNGTIINKTILLRKGEKRRLHNGDEICLVNPHSLRKKIRSKQTLQELLQHHSYIFVQNIQHFPHPSTNHQILPPLSLHASVIARQRLSPPSFPSASAKRRPAVDARATKQPGWMKPQAFTSRSSLTGPGNAFAYHLSFSDLADASSSNTNKNTAHNFQDMKRIEEDYDIRDLLGSGTAGEVRRAIHRKTGEERAVKVVSLGRNRGAAMNVQEAHATFVAEASILRGLEHPYVVKLIDAYVSPTAVYLVMELLQGGDLFDRIVQKGRYTELESRRLMRRLLSAIHYLHGQNTVHRDLKPENILCVHRGDDVDIKLTDFGLAKTIQGNEGLKTFVGTLNYIAPEVLRRSKTVAGRGRYGKKADMWSVGVTLYVLLSGTPPFEGSLGFDMVDGADIEYPDEFWHDVSDLAKDLVRQLLTTDPDQRLSVEQACNHAWILQDDGDTHVHPLDDPKLAVSKKRLFSAEATSSSEMQSFKATTAELVVRGEQVSHKEKITIAEHSSCEKIITDEETAETPLSSTEGRGFSNHSSDQRSCCELSKANEAACASFRASSPVNGVAEEPRCPLSPVSLNSNADDRRQSPRAVKQLVVGKDIETIALRMPVAPSLGLSNNYEDSAEIRSFNEDIERSEDEVVSDFAERTESVDSFHNSGNDNGPSSLPEYSEALSKEQRDESNQRSRKRRVTDSDDKLMHNILRKKIQKTESKFSPGAALEAGAAGESAAMKKKGSNKQTTLLKWVKKTNYSEVDN